MKTVLILTLFMWGSQSSEGMGGASVELMKFDSLAQCEQVKQKFLEMKITHKELVNSRLYARSKITRKAECILLRTPSTK